MHAPFSCIVAIDFSRIWINGFALSYRHCYACGITGLAPESLLARDLLIYPGKGAIDMNPQDPEKTNPPSPEQRPKVRPEQPADDAPPAPAQHQGATETDVTHTT